MLSAGFSWYRGDMNERCSCPPEGLKTPKKLGNTFREELVAGLLKKSKPVDVRYNYIL